MGLNFEDGAEVNGGTPFAEAGGYAVAEAVKGLCAAKLELIKCRDSLREQGMWMRFDEIWKQYTAELAAIDARLDDLMKPHTAIGEPAVGSPTH
jgi:hypothetical protein